MHRRQRRHARQCGVSRRICRIGRRLGPRNHRSGRPLRRRQGSHPAGRRAGQRRRSVRNRGFRKPHHRQRGVRRRRVLRHPDAPQGDGRRKSGQGTLPGGPYRRPTVSGLPGRDARRRAHVLSRRRGEADHRSGGAAQPQRLPLAPDRRSGVADRDRRLSPPDGNRGFPPRHDARGRAGHLRRLLHQTADPRHRRVCRTPVYRGRSGDRHAGPHDGGARLLPRTRMHGRAVRHHPAAGRAPRHPLRGQSRSLRFRGKGPRRGDRTLPLEVHPHRGRRIAAHTVAGVSQMPVADPQGGAESRHPPQRRRQTSGLLQHPDREISLPPRAAADRLGRNRGRRHVARRHGHVVARNGGWHPGRRRGFRRHHVAQLVALFRLLPVGEHRHRTAHHRRLYSAEKGLRHRTRSRRADAGAGPPHYRRAGQRVDDLHADRYDSGTHAAAPAGGARGKGMVGRGEGFHGSTGSSGSTTATVTATSPISTT